MKNFLTAIVATLFLLTAVTHAEVKVYDGEGTYVMSEGENLGVAKERAKADAMRNACEKAGTYVKSYSRSINNELAEDVIETITANIVKLVEEPHFFPLEEVDNLGSKSKSTTPTLKDGSTSPTTKSRRSSLKWKLCAKQTPTRNAKSPN